MRHLLVIFVSAIALAAQPIVLKTSTLVDGKGKILHNQIIVVEGQKIARIGGGAPTGAGTFTT